MREHTYNPDQGAVDMTGIYASAPRGSSIEQILNETFVNNAGCCGSMRSITAGGQERVFIYPVEWLPKGFNEKKIVELIGILNTFDASLEFLGFIETPKLKYLKDNLNVVVGQALLQGKEHMYASVKGDQWATFRNLNSDIRTQYQNYFSFCLIRALFCSHYQSLYIDMFKIKEKEDWDWFTCFQIAHYGQSYYNGRGFKYTHVQKLQSLEGFKAVLPTNKILNECFGEQLKLIGSGTLNDLFNNGNYRKIRKTIT